MNFLFVAFYVRFVYVNNQSFNVIVFKLNVVISNLLVTFVSITQVSNEE